MKNHGLHASNLVFRKDAIIGVIEDLHPRSRVAQPGTGTGQYLP